MKTDFWLEKWKTGDIRFHQEEFETNLIENAKRFSKLKKILVPLCGKSLDLIYLKSLGHSVIGVELSQIACEAFFSENKIDFKKENKKDFIVYSADNITLYCGDFFHLPTEIWKTITAIYDRAALIALPPEMRQQYMKFISENAPPATEMLLIKIKYSDESIDGPPFSVSDEEILTHYNSAFQIEKIRDEDISQYMNNHPKLKALTVVESVFWLKHK